MKSLIKMLRAQGITHYEHNGIVLHLGVPPVRYPKSDAKDGAPVPHVIQELESLMKLDDTQLVERLFPQPKDEGDDA